MCPACVTATAWWVIGGASGGGLLTWGVFKVRRLFCTPFTKDSPSDTNQQNYEAIKLEKETWKNN